MSEAAVAPGQTATPSAAQAAAARRPSVVDAVVVGAGFAGLYMLHRLRQLGLSTRVLEAADDVGGTWYWNRYPGARCDIPTTDYTYSFDPELEQAWAWSEKYATQPEILRYAQFVARRYDLYSGIDFKTRMQQARWDEAQRRWHIRTDAGEDITARFTIMATGCLSVPKQPELPGADRFKGKVYTTGRWPHGGVDFTGRRVAVIGTGSSGVQSIPLIAEQADSVVVFQRTPNFTIPARNSVAKPARHKQLLADRQAYREAARYSRAGVPIEPTMVMGRFTPPEVHDERFEAAWHAGDLVGALGIFADQALFKEANDLIAERIRAKIRDIVNDPETAEALCPTDHPFGSKRPCLDTGYFATFNRPNVTLVDIRRRPIEAVTATGIALKDGELAFDDIVYATGFDAMTGALVAVDIQGRDGLTLAQKWAQGPQTYLGLMSRGFPNLFMITGPGSPSVMSNMMVSIEQHVDWISDTLAHMAAIGDETMEPTQVAEDGWVQHVADCADITLLPQANSWYIGANVPGKPRVYLPYLGGVDRYRRTCEAVVAGDYLGFAFRGQRGEHAHDGVVSRLQPDVQMVLEMVASLNLPPFETLPPQAARDLLAQINAERPPGAAMGEIRDGQLPGAAGPLDYRLYRPATPGPHPVVVYFHGGGWVIGHQSSDEPLCRDLAHRANALVVSVNYRHAPEARFPAAADDAVAAVRWVGAHAAELGGIAGPLVVAGWSAGANLAAVVCQQVRDGGGPPIAGQLMLTPVTDAADTSRPSYTENADGYVLTAPLMHWFIGHYVDEADRTDPRVSPLRAQRLDGLPPACIVTADFDPLRDEGRAYGQALAAAGVPVHPIRARGHTHTSVTMVDIIVSGAPVREQMAQALRGFFRQAGLVR